MFCEMICLIIFEKDGLPCTKCVCNTIELPREVLVCEIVELFSIQIIPLILTLAPENMEIVVSLPLSSEDDERGIR